MPKTPRYNANGYDTDHLIQGMTDRELLGHMGVPDHIREYAIRSQPDVLPAEIEFWIEHLPYIFRPQDDKNEEKPELHAKGLILYGPGGKGKTVMASTLLLRVIRMGIKNSDPSLRNFTWHGWAMGLFVDWQDASELFRRAAGKDEEAAFMAADLVNHMKPGGEMDERGDFLVIDDISRERATEFNSGELQRILRRRQNYGYPTILTTNHSPKEWFDVYGDVLGAFLARSFISVEFS